MPISTSLEKDKDGQFKVKTEAFAAKTVLISGGEMSLYKRIHGKKYDAVPAGVTTDLDFTVPYAIAKIEAIEIINGKLGDSLTFEVMMVIGGVLTVINTFGFDLFVDDSGYYEQRSQYDADVNNTITFRVKYQNNGVERPIYINYVLNEVK